MLEIAEYENPVTAETRIFEIIEERLKIIRRNEGYGSNYSTDNAGTVTGIAKQIIMLVPAQYTLHGEESAFRYIKAEGFLDFHIMSENKFREEILKETGGSGKTPVNSLGQTMLLRKITKKLAPGFKAYTKLAGDKDFLQMVGDFIVQMHRNNINAEDLEKLAGTETGESLLKNKLHDMQLIADAYEEIMADKFTDSEDNLSFVTLKAAESKLIKTSEIWMYGYYSFTRRELDFIAALKKHSPDLFICLHTGCEPAASELMDPFSITRATGNILLEYFPDSRVVHIDTGEKYCGSNGIPEENHPLQKLCVECESPETQGMAVGLKILELIRKGCGFGDIAVVTRDFADQGMALKRCFEDLGIPYFQDEKRSIMHQEATELISALLSLASGELIQASVLKYIKARQQLCGEYTDAGVQDEFYSYIRDYHIKHNTFLKPFKYGGKALGEEKLAALEEIRAAFAREIKPFTEAFNKAETVKEKSLVLYSFLSENLELPRRLKDKSGAMADTDFIDASEESIQIWKVICDALDQLTELLGEERESSADYAEILTDSFKDIKMGLLPQSEGKVLLGDAGRSMLSGYRAVFITGFNEGIIPAENSDSRLLTDSEQDRLEKQGICIYKGNRQLSAEELYSIELAMESPSELLWLSYPVSDSKGETLKPSSIITGLIERGSVNRVSDKVFFTDEAFLQGEGAALGKLTEVLGSYKNEDIDKIPDIWGWVFDRLKEQNTAGIRAVSRGFTEKRSISGICRASEEELYDFKDGDFVLSPSSLEKYRSCPFNYFVDKGLKPEIPEAFDITGKELGTICHEVLRELSIWLSDRGGPSAAGSRWQNIPEEDIIRQVDLIIDMQEKTAFEGILERSGADKYKSARIRALCKAFALRMTEQVRKGKIDYMMFETPFGKGKRLPGVSFTAGSGRVRIEGKIDRVDVSRAAGGDFGNYVKIIDYKSGGDKFSKSKVENGYKLQLMLYLEAAVDGIKGKPLGVFYYPLKAPYAPGNPLKPDAEYISNEVLAGLEKSLVLSGTYDNSSEAVRLLDRTAEETGSSSVISIKYNKDGSPSKGYGLSPEEFSELREKFKEKVKESCAKYIAGDIGADPLPGACSYCDFSDVCGRE